MRINTFDGCLPCIDEICRSFLKASESPGKGRHTLTCTGAPCDARQKRSSGNKLCSNGQLCKDCCLNYQGQGFPPCRHSAHNIGNRGIDFSSQTSVVQSQNCFASAVAKVANSGLSGARVSETASVPKPAGPHLPIPSAPLAPLTTISPYHNRHGPHFVGLDGESTRERRPIHFQATWHRTVSPCNIA